MIIKRFVGTRMHGYINVDVEFFPDLTFLFGINGSGKTTIVRLLHAMLSLSTMVLTESDYEYIAIEVEFFSKIFEISAKKTPAGTEISTTETTGVLELKKYVGDEDMPLSRLEDGRLDWYSNQTTLQSENVVVKFIESLPSPMYLGLERRSGLVTRRYARSPSRELRHSIFSSSLQASLLDASHFAADAFRKAYTAESLLKDTLRNELILISFAFEDVSQGITLSRKIPKKADADRLASAHSNIIDALSTIGLEGGKIEKSVEGFFSALGKIIKDLPEIKGKKADLNPNDLNKILRYEFNKLQFDRANKIAERVENFTKEVKEIYKSIESYKVLMNDFLGPSHKAIVVDNGGLSVDIANVGRRDVASLSSGEQQLVVLITQLWFNPSATKSNILIIDEPELSLHLRWQEMFVDALQKAHSGLQLILATHSPSIILDRDEKARELVPQYA